MSVANKHLKLNGKFLKDAKALLDKQDYVQASEKLWGAAAQVIKAIALKRGKRPRSREASINMSLNSNHLNRPKTNNHHHYLQLFSETDRGYFLRIVKNQ